MVWGTQFSGRSASQVDSHRWVACTRRGFVVPGSANSTIQDGAKAGNGGLGCRKVVATVTGSVMSDWNCSSAE